MKPAGRRPLGPRGGVPLSLWVALGLGLVPGQGTLQAQQVSVLRLQHPQAWIGFSFELREAWRGGAEPENPMAVVTDVYPESPARRAGLQVGDTILRLNDAPAGSEAFVRLQATLQPGDRVHFTLRRQGRVRDVELRAQARPADETLVALSPEVRIQLESAHDLFLKHLDSAGMTSGLTAFQYQREGDTVSALIWRTLDEVESLDPWIALPDPTFAPPFPFLLLQDGRSEELLGRLRQLEREMRETQLSPATGPPEVARAAEIRREAEAVKHDMQVLAEAMLSPTSPAVRASPSGVRGTSTTVPVSRAPEPEGFARPLAPYITGQDRVAGARLTPLNPELGAYFGVSRGLLVVEVGLGTPAEEAGMLPGDVVVSVMDLQTSTLDQLRRALAGAQRFPATVTLIRRGRRIQLALPH